MSWQNTVRKCVVSPCKATKCKHNKKRECVLPKVTISEKGMCEQFTTIHRKRH